MFPPLALVLGAVARVVTELFVAKKFLPALIMMLPASPAPVLLAETLAPLVRVADWLAVMVMLPPAPSPDVDVEMWPPFAIVTVGAETVIWPPLPVAPKSLVLFTLLARPEMVA